RFSARFGNIGYQCQLLGIAAPIPSSCSSATSIAVLREPVMDRTLFPVGCFSDDPAWDLIWRELYADRLRAAAEKPLYGSHPAMSRVSRCVVARREPRRR